MNYSKKKDEETRKQAVYHWLNKSQQKRIAYFEGGRKRKHKNNTTLKAVAKTASLSITYQKKKKRKPKKANDKKTIKGPTLKMKMITMT